MVLRFQTRLMLMDRSESYRTLLQLGPDVPAGTVIFLLLVNFELKPFLLLVPYVFCTVIASDSIAGEKERKTIESFPVLPLFDREIIIGKIIGALIPALGAAWLSFGVMGLAINVTAGPALSGKIVIFNDLTWWFLMIFIVPLLSFIAHALHGPYINHSTECKDCPAILDYHHTPDDGADFRGHLANIRSQHH